ncbi:hypothetical protein GOP47_0004316 [Adiantum capillus-veneris]|uniref:Uncharacterized protein n=1 Tax=Adiantum capillus-veneris TaxID=13818 RepID=A0A9D4V7N4_ADICA|nr:hypothetical protein GOP47_0004316 [Adiantum capillus-veneris]
MECFGLRGECFICQRMVWHKLALGEDVTWLDRQSPQLAVTAPIGTGDVQMASPQWNQLRSIWPFGRSSLTGGLEVLDGPPPENILVGPRVGIDYANPEDVAALWRFAVAGTPWISAPRNTLAPPQSSA